jgi:hypothetical protein
MDEISIAVWQKGDESRGV